jgi:hypothetical protein
MVIDIVLSEENKFMLGDVLLHIGGGVHGEGVL